MRNLVLHLILVCLASFCIKLELQSVWNHVTLIVDVPRFSQYENQNVMLIVDALSFIQYGNQSVMLIVDAVSRLDSLRDQWVFYLLLLAYEFINYHNRMRASPLSLSLSLSLSLEQDGGRVYS